MRADIRQKRIQHRQSMSATDNLRMHAEREDATITVSVGIIEFSLPDLAHCRRWCLSWAPAVGKLEVREVIKDPTERNFNDFCAFTEHVGLGRAGNIPLAKVIAVEVVA